MFLGFLIVTNECKDAKHAETVLFNRITARFEFSLNRVSLTRVTVCVQPVLTASIKAESTWKPNAPDE